MKKIFYFFVVFFGLNIHAQEYNIIDFSVKPAKMFISSMMIY